MIIIGEKAFILCFLCCVVLRFFFRLILTFWLIFGQLRRRTHAKPSSHESYELRGYFLNRAFLLFIQELFTVWALNSFVNSDGLLKVCKHVFFRPSTTLYQSLFLGAAPVRFLRGNGATLFTVTIFRDSLDEVELGLDQLEIGDGLPMWGNLGSDFNFLYNWFWLTTCHLNRERHR